MLTETCLLVLFGASTYYCGYVYGKHRGESVGRQEQRQAQKDFEVNHGLKHDA